VNAPAVGHERFGVADAEVSGDLQEDNLAPDPDRPLFAERDVVVLGVLLTRSASVGSMTSLPWIECFRTP
jgi:hypothetical protein